MKNRVKNKKIIKNNKIILDWGVLIKLIKGVKITKIEPETLLIKNRG